MEQMRAMMGRMQSMIEQHREQMQQCPALVVCPLMRDEPTAQNPKINYLFFGAQRSVRAALLRFADRLVAGTRLGTDDIVSALA